MALGSRPTTDICAGGPETRIAIPGDKAGCVAPPSSVIPTETMGIRSRRIIIQTKYTLSLNLDIQIMGTGGKRLGSLQGHIAAHHLSLSVVGR